MKDSIILIPTLQEAPMGYRLKLPPEATELYIKIECSKTLGDRSCSPMVNLVIKRGDSD